MAKGIYRRGKIWWIRYAGLDSRIISVSMNKLIMLILCFTVLLGCATRSEHLRRYYEHGQDDYDNYPKVPRLGLTVEMRDNKLIVSDVVKFMPAYQAKMKAGDIVVSLDGFTITSPPEFRMVLNNKKSNNEVSLMLIRNGKTLDITVTPALQKVRPTLMMIDKLVLDGKHVHVAVIVSKVSVDSPYLLYDPRKWIIDKRKNLRDDEERGLYESYKGVKNFLIVDQSKLKAIIDTPQFDEIRDASGKYPSLVKELKSRLKLEEHVVDPQFDQVGFTSDKSREIVRKMTGATHIIEIACENFAFNISLTYMRGNDMIIRLIDIESGKVLATDNAITYAR